MARSLSHINFRTESCKSRYPVVCWLIYKRFYDDQAVPERGLELLESSVYLRKSERILPPTQNTPLSKSTPSGFFNNSLNRF
jgi:hypothetical protein